MAINNLPKTSSTLNNVPRVNIGETWATIPTTWASEIKTWDEMASLIENQSRVVSVINNQAKP